MVIANDTEILRHFGKTQKALTDIEQAETSQDLRDAWEEYLHSFHRVIGRLIASSLKTKQAQAWGHRLKNKSNGHDPGLTFLREARAHAEHGLTPFANFTAPGVAVADDFVFISVDLPVIFSGNTYNGRPIGEFCFETKNGRIQKISGEAKAAIEEVKAMTVLKPIKSDNKKKVIPVPKTICGRVIPKSDPQVLAKESFLALKEIVNEYKDLTQQKK